MSTKDNGGSAFPEIFTDIRGERGDYHPDTYSAGGMSLRDYFAAMAITAAAADELRHPTYDEATYKGTAVRAYLYADAMIKARQS